MVHFSDCKVSLQCIICAMNTYVRSTCIHICNTYLSLYTLQVKNIEHLDAGVKAVIMAQLTNV